MQARNPKGILIAVLGIAPLGLFAQDPYAITGVSVSDPENGVPLRRNINELQAAGGAQWYGWPKDRSARRMLGLILPET